MGWDFPELFGVADLLRQLCGAPGVSVNALARGGDMHLSFFKAEGFNADQWLWQLDVIDDVAMVEIRTVASHVEGRKFLASLLSEIYGAHDATQLVEWWRKGTQLMLTTVTTELPRDPEIVLDLFTQLDQATRECAMP